MVSTKAIILTYAHPVQTVRIGRLRLIGERDIECTGLDYLPEISDDVFCC
jgi:hypothetical protein